MIFFRRVRTDVEVSPILLEIHSRDYAWNFNTSRQDRIPVQKHTNSIFLAGAVDRPDLHVNENQESCLTKLAPLFPKTVSFLSGFAQEMNASLSRAAIVRLQPRSQVYLHVDFGSYYLIRDRYHLVLESATGSVLCSGNEKIRMRPGELWWFNNKQYHSSFNDSDSWRIHLIFDLLPTAYRSLAVNPMPREKELFDTQVGI
jgi:Aspartyl/Asparaginyl beta-hydroxylase